MSEFMSYDPWRNVTTRNGIPGDEVISALQKSIRKGNEEIAVDVAYEMYITSEQFEDKLWRRLLSICVEDIGFGNPQAPILISTLNNLRKEFPYNDGDRPMFFIHAIRFLCSCYKERSSDALKNITIKKFEQGYVPQIPDYAYDMHTQKGRKMGRDAKHFQEVASVVTPMPDNYDDSYRQRLIAMLDEEKEMGDNTPKAQQPFVYGVWQF